MRQPKSPATIAEFEESIALARAALETAERMERDAAELVAKHRTRAADKNLQRSERRKLAKEADRIERKLGKDVVAARASANKLLRVREAELAKLKAGSGN
jgi:hypothetical protein